MTVALATVPCQRQRRAAPAARGRRSPAGRARGERGRGEDRAGPAPSGGVPPVRGERSGVIGGAGVRAWLRGLGGGCGDPRSARWQRAAGPRGSVPRGSPGRSREQAGRLGEVPGGGPAVAPGASPAVPSTPRCPPVSPRCSPVPSGLSPGSPLFPPVLSGLLPVSPRCSLPGVPLPPPRSRLPRRSRRGAFAALGRSQLAAVSPLFFPPKKSPWCQPRRSAGREPSPTSGSCPPPDAGPRFPGGKHAATPAASPVALGWCLPQARSSCSLTKSFRSLT